MLRFVAFFLALELASFAADGAAQSSHATLAVGIRIASATEHVPRFENSLDTAMRSGTRPLDWALAATSSPKPSRTIGATTPRSDGDLFRAAQAAPNDALVQWLVANYADTSTPEGAAHRAAAIDALARIEPDNGAIWMQALAEAARRGDADGVDDALAHMAEARRFDDHFVDVVHAWLDVYERHPAPASFAKDGYDAGFVAAFAKAAATGIPAYNPLILACKPADAGSFNRTPHCTAVGHLMLDRANALVPRTIGFSILQGLGVATDADRAQKRTIAWYYVNAMRGTGEDGNARDALAYETDWRAMNDEGDVKRNALRRAGLPIEPPADWDPHASADLAVAR